RSHAKRAAGNKPDLGRAFANQRTPPTKMIGRSRSMRGLKLAHYTCRSRKIGRFHSQRREHGRQTVSFVTSSPAACQSMDSVSGKLKRVVGELTRPGACGNVRRGW